MTHEIQLSPDGQRVVLTVATLSSDRTKYDRALWSVAPDGSGTPTRITDSVIITADLLPRADGIEAKASLRARRSDSKVAAILHESYPIPYGDHDLGPSEPHLLALDLSMLADRIASVPVPDDAATTRSAFPIGLPRPRKLTSKPGRTAGHRSRNGESSVMLVCWRGRSPVTRLAG
jgi:hypothetical protein